MDTQGNIERDNKYAPPFTFPVKSDDTVGVSPGNLGDMIQISEYITGKHQPLCKYLTLPECIPFKAD